MVLVNLEAIPLALVAATWRQQFYTADMAATGAEPTVGERVDHDSLLGSFFSWMVAVECINLCLF